MTRPHGFTAIARLTAFLTLCAVLSVAETAQAADKITFVTDYGLYGRHAYYFVAMEKGYYARENIEIDIVRSEAGEILHKYQRGIDVGIAIGETSKVKELAVQPNVPLGTIDPARVQKTIDTVAAAFQLKNKVSPDDVYAPGLLPE